MAKKTSFIILALITLIIFNLSASNVKSLKEEKDFAVPAFSDFFVLGGTRIFIHQIAGPMTPEENSPLPDLFEMRRLDINRDLQLNDFDVKQFEAIVEKLGGADLSVKELIARFRLQQEEKTDPFALIYDLDRDGKFTPYDVDYFTELVGGLDESGSPTRRAVVADGSPTRRAVVADGSPGSELVKKFRERIF